MPPDYQVLVTFLAVNIIWSLNYQLQFRHSGIYQWLTPLRDWDRRNTRIQDLPVKPCVKVKSRSRRIIASWNNKGEEEEEEREMAYLSLMAYQRACFESTSEEVGRGGSTVDHLFSMSKAFGPTPFTQKQNNKKWCLEQWFSAFLLLWLFTTIPHVVLTLKCNIFAATS